MDTDLVKKKHGTIYSSRKHENGNHSIIVPVSMRIQLYISFMHIVRRSQNRGEDE